MQGLRRGERWCYRDLLLQDRVIAIANQLGARVLRILDVAKRPYLNMEEFVVLGPASGKGRILFFLKGVHQRFSILLLAYRRYLHVVRTIAGDSGGIRSCRVLRRVP